MTSTRFSWKTLGVAGMLAVTTMPGHVAASPGPLPATLYPAHTRITSMQRVTNQQMDCDWGFACHDGKAVTSAPVFHLRTQDDLHRLSGWAQFGDTRGRSGRILFALFASRYSPDSEEGMPWNVRAFADFRGTLMASGYADIDPVPRLVPRRQIGNASEQVARSRSGDMLAMACWTGSVEVEGVVVYAHHSRAAKQLAIRYLVGQIRAAVTSVQAS